MFILEKVTKSITKLLSICPTRIQIQESELGGIPATNKIVKCCAAGVNPHASARVVGDDRIEVDDRNALGRNVVVEKGSGSVKAVVLVGLPREIVKCQNLGAGAKFVVELHQLDVGLVFPQVVVVGRGKQTHLGEECVGDGLNNGIKIRSMSDALCEELDQDLHELRGR